MGLKVKDEGGSFTPAPAGNHIAICYGVIDLGTQHSDAFTWEGKSIPASDRPQILLMWELPNETVDIDGEEKPAVVSKFYNAFFGEKAALRIHLESWRGRQFTEEELCGFDVSKLLGVPCMLNIVHTEAGKAKVAGVAPLPKGMPAPSATNDLVMFDLDEFDRDIFENLSEGIRAIIQKSPEFKKLNGTPPGFREEAPDFTDDEIPF